MDKYTRGQMTILQTGPNTTLQDLGRTGSQHLGFCQSGAADEYSFRWANKLLDNPYRCAALEITLGQFHCRFDAPTRIAITGATTEIQFNNKIIYGWQKFDVNAGDEIKIALATQGVFIYIAIHGGFACDEPLFFNSHAMVPREKSGPFDGGPLLSRQSLAYRSIASPANKKAKDFYSASQNRLVSWRYIPDYRDTLTLGLIAGYQFDWLDEESKYHLFNSEFAIDTDSNKMGYRLQGSAIYMQQQQLLSEGIALGAVQIPANGQPIILLKDRQTIGGYPKIGCISKIDCFMLSQRRPGQKVRFSLKDLAQCEEDYREYRRFFSA